MSLTGYQVLVILTVITNVKACPRRQGVMDGEWVFKPKVVIQDSTKNFHIKADQERLKGWFHQIVSRDQSRDILQDLNKPPKSVVDKNFEVYFDPQKDMGTPPIKTGLTETPSDQNADLSHRRQKRMVVDLLATLFPQLTRFGGELLQGQVRDQAVKVALTGVLKQGEGDNMPTLSPNFQEVAGPLQPESPVLSSDQTVELRSTTRDKKFPIDQRTTFNKELGKAIVMVYKGFQSWREGLPTAIERKMAMLGDQLQRTPYLVPERLEPNSSLHWPDYNSLSLPRQTGPRIVVLNSHRTETKPAERQERKDNFTPPPELKLL